MNLALNTITDGDVRAWQATVRHLAARAGWPAMPGIRAGSEGWQPFVTAADADALRDVAFAVADHLLEAER